MGNAPWVLVPCLVVLRQEFNTLAPGRDLGADGSIGDTAHQQESSDHNPDETGRTPYSDADDINEVHAIDVDSTGPWPAGRDLAAAVEIIRTRHQVGKDDRLQNIIYQGKICSRTWGWTWRLYTGLSQHYDHAHFSARYTTAQEGDTRPWGILEGVEQPLNSTDVSQIWSAEIGSGNNRRTVATALSRAEAASTAAAQGVAALATAFANRNDVDEVALGQAVGDALRPHLAADIAGLLAQDGVDGTDEGKIREVLEDVLNRTGLGVRSQN